MATLTTILGAMTTGDETVGAPATPVLRFAAGLPGFPDARSFVLVEWGGPDSPFSLLRCLDDPTAEFVVVPPGVFFPDYAPMLDDDTLGRLRLEGPEEALVLVMVTVREHAEDATANLMAPVVVNTRTLDAVQAVLSGSGYDLRAPLVDGSPGQPA